MCLKNANLQRQTQGHNLDRFIWWMGIQLFAYHQGKFDPQPFTGYHLWKLLTQVLKALTLKQQQLLTAWHIQELSRYNLYYHLARYEQEGYLTSEMVLNPKNRKERHYRMTTTDILHFDPEYIR
jgi:hypothetical protein